jgi:hypothetical protein
MLQMPVQKLLQLNEQHGEVRFCGGGSGLASLPERRNRKACRALLTLQNGTLAPVNI